MDINRKRTFTAISISNCLVSPGHKFAPYYDSLSLDPHLSDSRLKTDLNTTIAIGKNNGHSKKIIQNLITKKHLKPS